MQFGAEMISALHLPKSKAQKETKNACFMIRNDRLKLMYIEHVACVYSIGNFGAHRNLLTKKSCARKHVIARNSNINR